MKIIYFRLICVLLFLSLSSCAKMIYTIVAPQKPHFKKFEKCNDGNCKSIVFVTMTHVAKPDFFEKVKREVDSHRANGYTVFYEGAGAFPDDMNLQTKDTLKRKFRKILKYFAEDYLEYEAFPSYFKKNGFVMQTNENTGLDKNKDYNVDVFIPELVQLHEQKFGLIELDSCDFKTDFNKKYYCDLAEGGRNYVLKEVRDAYIAEEVLNSDKDKIIMLYGKAHYKPLRKKLKSEGFQRK